MDWRNCGFMRLERVRGVEGFRGIGLEVEGFSNYTLTCNLSPSTYYYYYEKSDFSRKF